MGFLSSLLLLTSLACGSLAQSTTLNLFGDIVGVGGSGQEFVGQVVSADCSKTTVALSCTAGSFNYAGQSLPCSGLSVTAVYDGSTSFAVSTSGSTAGTQAAIAEDCTISGTTQAVCTASLDASADGQSFSYSTVSTLTGDQVTFFQVPITAGASRLPATSTCSSDNPAPTLAVDFYKVVVVPAAAILAGAALL